MICSLELATLQEYGAAKDCCRHLVEVNGTMYIEGCHGKQGGGSFNEFTTSRARGGCHGEGITPLMILSLSLII